MSAENQRRRTINGAASRVTEPEAGGQDQRSPARDPRQAVRRVNSWTSAVKFVPDRAIKASDKDDWWKSCSSTDPTRTCRSCELFLVSLLGRERSSRRPGQSYDNEVSAP